MSFSGTGAAQTERMVTAAVNEQRNRFTPCLRAVLVEPGLYEETMASKLFWLGLQHAWPILGCVDSMHACMNLLGCPLWVYSTLTTNPLALAFLWAARDGHLALFFSLLGNARANAWHL